LAGKVVNTWESDYEPGQDVRKPPKPGNASERPVIGGPGESGPQNSVFKAHRHSPDYPGLKCKDLTPGESLVQYVTKQGKRL